MTPSTADEARPQGVPLAAPREGLATVWVAGALRSIPFLIVMIPFGLVFGVASINAGLSFWQTVAFSTIVLAGASQITALQLMVDHAPLAIILLSAMAVNLRMAMYSASLVPWLGQASAGLRAVIAYVLIDQTFALSLARFEADPRMTLRQRVAYFFGTVTMLALPWPLFTALGATLGRTIPPQFALDFAVPITFLAMIAPSLRSVPHLAAAATGFTLALVFAWLPSGLGLIVAAAIAMMVGAEVERREARRKAGQA